MPKIVANTEFDAISGIIASQPKGISASAIHDQLPFALPTRTLQRRLKRLVEEGRIHREGSKKGARYFPLSTHDGNFSLRETPPPRQPCLAGERIVFSQQAESIRAYINQPLMGRTPIGYQSDFLDSYEPNVSAYLSADIRCELAKAGKVGASQLPAGTYLRQIMDRLLIDLTWNSSRLEGNTYSLLETQRLLDIGENAEGKNSEESQMILNHKAAIEMLADQADTIGFNHYTICNLHALLADNLLSEQAACGRVRTRPVGITGTVFHPLAVPSLIEQHFDEILLKSEQIKDPFEQAFFAMVHLPYLQPFEDVNKRVSRLSANIPLVRYNLCPLSFVDVPQEDYLNGIIGIYELNQVDYMRDVFVWAYHRSAARYSAVRESLGDPDPFRLRYRKQIGDFVREVVQSCLEKSTAAKHIAKRAQAEIPQLDRAKFIEVVETELSSLHIGNIARFRLHPVEFETWIKQWS